MKKTRRRYDRDFKISVLKNAFAMTQKKVREDRLKPMLRDDT